MFLLNVFVLFLAFCQVSPMTLDSLAFKFEDDGDTPVVEFKSYTFHGRMASFSLCMWVKRAREGQVETFFVYEPEDGDNEIRLSFTADGNTEFLVKNEVIGTAAVPPGTDKWMHLCYSWSSSLKKWAIFVNGQEAASGVPSVLAPLILEGRIFLGQDSEGDSGNFIPDRSFKGEISEVQMESFSYNDYAANNAYRCTNVAGGNQLSPSTVQFMIDGKVKVYQTKMPCGFCEG